MLSFGITNAENSTGLILQVSKISFAGFFIFVLLFQQLDVGSEASASTTPDIFYSGKDTIREPDTANKSLTDTIVADTLSADTNISGDESLKSPVKYHARDSIRVNIENEVVYLYGNATVDYEDMHMQADYIVIDMNGKELFAEGVKDSLGNITGSPQFSQADQKFRSSTIRYNFDTKKGKITYVITQEGEGYIHGEVVKKDPENNFFIKRGQYTTCDLDTPHFAITSNRLKVINKNKIITGPAYLTIENVPTPLILPFGFFPNSPGRSSGIIFPSFGESAERGFYLERLGYYFGFNDYINLAVTTDLYTKGSYKLEAASIYKKKYKYSGNMNVSYAYTVDGEKELPGYSVTKDYHIRWYHSQDSKFSPNNNFSADVNAGSSTYYTNTITSLNNFLTNQFQSTILYSHTFPDKPINLSLAIKHFQNILTKQISITAPELGFNVSRFYPLKRKNAIGKQKWYEKIGTSYTLYGENYIDTYDSLLFTQSTLENLKTGFQHTIPVSTSFNVLNYYNVSPSFNYSERWYFKTRRLEWDSDSSKVDTSEVEKFQSGREYQFSLGTSTRIYGMYQFTGGPIAALRHVITPTASISFRPDFGKEKYGYYKEVQVDTAGDTRTYSIFDGTRYGGPSNGRYANINFSLDNNLEMKVKTNSDTGMTLKKVKIFETLRISSGYNLIADSMKLALINLNGSTTILDKVGIRIRGTLDPYAYDENNRDYDKYNSSVGGSLVRLTSASINTGFSLNQAKVKESTKYSKEELDYINNHPDEYVDFNVPYNLTVDYILNYSKNGGEPSKLSQSANINGELRLTPAWKIAFTSFYDITEGQFTSMGINFYRDLHCWEMRLNWIPFGYQESWNFQINVKASVLQDLKLLKKKSFFDQ